MMVYLISVSILLTSTSVWVYSIQLPSVRLYQEELGLGEEAVNNFFHGCSCVAINIDENRIKYERSSSDIMKVFPTVIGIPYQEFQCEGYYLYELNRENLLKSINSIKLYHTVRIIIVAEESAEYLADNIHLFGQADVILTGNRKIFYRLTPPLIYPRHFSVITSTSKEPRTMKWFDSNGFPFRVEIYDYRPFCIFNNDSFDGTEVMLFKQICELYNFTPHIKKYSGKDNYGFVAQNGTWIGGPLSLLAADEVDVCFCSLWITYDRYRVSDSSRPWNQACMTYLVPRPTEVINVWRGVFLPLENTIWLLLGFGTLSFAFILWVLVNEFESNSEKNRYHSIWTCILDTVGLLVFTFSPPAERQRSAIRQLLLCWSMFALLMVTAYSCQLVRYLSVPRFTPRLDTVEALVEKKIRWGSPYPENLDERFGTENPWYNKLKKLFTPEANGEERLRRLRKGNYANRGQVFNGHFSYGGPRIEPELLNQFRVMRECISIYSVAWAVRRHSPFKSPIDTVIGILDQAGILTFWENTKIRNYLDKSNDRVMEEFDDWRKEDGPAPLKINQLGGAFLLLIVGLIAGLVTFVIGNCRYYTKVKNIL